jgi:Bacterial regulatory helix-turn-helix protein, lysR family
MNLLNRLPPLNALRAFEVVARHLSFARAAEELHVTKAAVAQQARPEQERSPKDWRSSPRPRAPCARVTGAAFW